MTHRARQGGPLRPGFGGGAVRLRRDALGAAARLLAVCGELPDKLVYLGAAIVTAAGLFVIWRERQLGLKRAREAEGPPQAA
jgi:hypothetical protein